jgi:Predicted phosphotransferase related to Ser/Thr protein kinases
MYLHYYETLLKAEAQSSHKYRKVLLLYGDFSEFPVMSNTTVIGLDRQLEPTLENIREILTTKIPAYIGSRRRGLRSGSLDTDIVSYKILGCHVTSLGSSNSADCFTSHTYRAEILVEENRTKVRGDNICKIVRKESLIVKRITGNESVGDVRDCKHLFYVESKMLSDIVPLLLSSPALVAGDRNCQYSSSNLYKAYSLFPTCYFTSRKRNDSLIVLEDFQGSEYRFGGSNSLLLDFDHIVLGLESLARFHALSYALKKRDSQSFYSCVVHKVKNGKKFCAEDKDNELVYAHAYLHCLQFAALQPLELFATKFLDGSQKYISGVRRLNVLLEDTAGLIRKLLIPKEPLAVLCHGNYYMRNILYRYDANNKPIAVKLIDFRDVHYASPAIDLTVFLFLSASPELLAESLDDFICIYHQSLLKAMSEFLDCPEEDLLPEYSVDAFKDEFSRHAVYGYVLTAAYLTSAVSTPVKIGKLFEILDDGFASREDTDECIRDNLKLEGEEATYRLVFLIKEILDKGYL